MLSTAPLSRLRAILPEPGPLRVLTVASLVNTAGRGLFMAVAVIYYTRVVGLSVAAVGVALSASALVAVALATPLGHLADRIGPRETAVVATALSGLVSASLLVVRGFWPLLLTLALWALTESAAHSARGALIGSVFAPEDRVRGRAYLRSVTNIGIMLGTAGAGLALHLDTPEAYRAMVAGDAVTFLVAALILLKLPHVAPAPHARGEPRLVALRDRPYLTVTALNGVLMMHFGCSRSAYRCGSWSTPRHRAGRWRWC